VPGGDGALHGLSLRADRRDVGGLLGQHRDDARLAVAGAVLFAASFLLMRAFGMNFDLPREPVQPGVSRATLSTEVLAAASTPTASLPAPAFRPFHLLPALPSLQAAALQ
jgi:hypothetical protein